MKLLLDTHVFLWWLTDPTRIPASVISTILDSHNDVLVSTLSLWEIAIKRTIGKLNTPIDLEFAATDEGFTVLPIELAHILATESLPLLHRDPFDRLLLAQAVCEQAAIVTHDRRLSSYPVQIVLT